MFTKAPLTLLLLLLTTVAQSAEVDVIALRAEAERLEGDMYRIFNELNSTDDFDVTCGNKAPTGSTIRVWSCDAAFMKDAKGKDVAARNDNPMAGTAYSQGSAGNTTGSFIPQSGKQMAFKYRKKAQALNDEMMALARQHPELASAMIALNNTRKQLAAAK